MSVEGGVRAVLSAIDRKIAGVAAFRATVTAVDGSLIQIRREGAVTAGTENYASCTRFLLAVGDVVLCLPLGSKPVVIDVIRRSAAATPTGVLGAAAGSTATYSITGNDNVMRMQIVPGGAGITTGTQLTVTFAVAKPSTSYIVLVSPASSAARTLGVVVGASTTNTTDYIFATAVALTSGSTYVWHVRIDMYG